MNLAETLQIHPKVLVFVNRYSGLILFCLALFVGLLTYDQYGLSWDDPMQRATGKVNYDYMFHNDQRLLTWRDRDYGPVYEVFLVGIEKSFNLVHTHDIYLMRHLVTHILFLISAFFCFLTVRLLLKSKVLAVLSFLLLVLHPRIYAQSFFNTKDIPFLSMFFISFYFMALAFQNKRLIYFILLGISVGILVNLRIMGVILLCLVPAFLIFDLIFEKSWKQNLSYILVFISTGALTLYATWPFLWPAPIANFIEAFENMSKFRWSGSVLLNGDIIKATELPWYYLPEWFSITTPILFLLLGFTGLGLFVYKFISDPGRFIKNTPYRNMVAYACVFISPLVAVIVLNSVVYDGWRQSYFVYSGFVMLMVFALYTFRRQSWIRWVTFFTFLYLLGVMVFYFPYQNVYFNSFLDFKHEEYIRTHFEMDYWGTASAESLLYILKNDTSGHIVIDGRNHTPALNMNLLKPAEQARVEFKKDAADADYFMTNFRTSTEKYTKYRGKKFYEVRRGRNTINAVYKLK